jgi:hypothetical protein
MTAAGTRATLEAAAVQRAISVKAIVATEGGTAFGRALTIGGALATETDVAPALTTADRGADSVGAIEPAAALRSR